MNRREFLMSAAAMAAPDGGKPMRGIFIILATPYTDDKAVDYETLAREVEFLDRAGVHGMVWPQLVSEFGKLTVEERLRGMEVLAKAARGRKPALVLGIQGPDTEAALVYARKAEELGPDAVIATPPTGAAGVEDARRYYSALAKAVQRPMFVQTTGGAKGLNLTPELLIELAKEHPRAAYVKEETEPVLERMRRLAAARPTIKGVFSGKAGRGMLYEMQLGMDGTMPGPAYADIYAQIWNHWQAGRRAEARELFARLLLMINVAEQIPGALLYSMKKRGVFRTIQSRQRAVRLTQEEMEAIDFHFESLKPFLKV